MILLMEDLLNNAAGYIGKKIKKHDFPVDWTGEWGTTVPTVIDQMRKGVRSNWGVVIMNWDSRAFEWARFTIHPMTEVLGAALDPDAEEIYDLSARRLKYSFHLVSEDMIKLMAGEIECFLCHVLDRGDPSKWVKHTVTLTGNGFKGHVILPEGYLPE